jgi:hypothetical protein
MGYRTGVCRFWWRDLADTDYWEDINVDGRIILKLIYKRWNGEAWTGLFLLRIGTGGRLL